MANLTRFNRLFGDTFFDDFYRPVVHAGADKSPAIDVHETDESYLIKVDLPGIKKDDIEVKLENGVLTVKAETSTEEQEEKEGRLIRQERHFGQFMRQLSVGSDVDPKTIKAGFDNGVLTLNLPKVKQDSPKAVSINVT